MGVKKKDLCVSIPLSEPVTRTTKGFGRVTVGGFVDGEKQWRSVGVKFVPQCFWVGIGTGNAILK